MNIDKLLTEAAKGGFSLAKLNFVLLRGIPFNKPHGLKILRLEAGMAHTRLPYRRLNLNHLKGLHACALATLAEYTSGLLLLRNFKASSYRLIMKQMMVVYHYQGRKNAECVFSISSDDLQKLTADLASGEPVLYTAVVEVKDTDQNLLCTAQVEWQLKSWDKVNAR